MVLSYKLTSVVLIFHLYFVVTKWPIHDSFIMEQRCQSLDHKIVSFVDEKYNITFTVKNEFHVLQQLLPEKTNCTYNLRSRQHDRQLTRKSTHINDSLFFIRMLYKDAYRRFRSIFVFLHFFVAFCQRFIYEYGYGWMDQTSSTTLLCGG